MSNEIMLPVPMELAGKVAYRLEGSAETVALGSALRAEILARRPPRLVEEPEGMGAVVFDDGGLPWVKVPAKAGGMAWRVLRAGAASTRPWDSDGDFYPIRCVSDGWKDQNHA